MLLSLLLLACDMDPKAWDTEPEASDPAHTEEVCEKGYVDADGDGYGGHVITTSCKPDWVPEGGDCDDEDPEVHPGVRSDDCDDVDNDCDYRTDEDYDGLTYTDADGDGFGTGEAEEECPGEDRAFEDGDCDDENEDVNPTASEVCGDDLDNDCNGLTDCEESGCFSTTCDEVCGDGADNDLDGLVDCEDGDCHASGPCYEGGDGDCDDGVDNDADGAADCDDDDCWGSDSCDPKVVSWRNSVGQATYRRRRRYSRYKSGGHWWSTHYDALYFYMYSLTGSAIAYGVDGTHSCAWTAGSFFLWGFGRPFAQQTSVQTTGDCNLGDLSFLPSVVYVDTNVPARMHLGPSSSRTYFEGGTPDRSVIRTRYTPTAYWSGSYLYHRFEWTSVVEPSEPYTFLP